MRKKLLCICLFIAVLGMAHAQTPTPAPVPSNLAAILFVQNSGRLDPTAQAQWEPQALTALAAGQPAFETASAMFSNPQLSAADKTTLTAYPDILVASSRAPSVLNVRYLVLARVAGDKHYRLEGSIVDISNNEQYPLIPVVLENKSNTQLMQKTAEAIHKLLKRIGERGSGQVLGNTESHMYHLPTAEHTDKSKLVPFADAKAARLAGYQPCPICFAEENKALKLDEDEGSLGLLMSEVMRLEFPISRNPDETNLDNTAARLIKANHLIQPAPVFKWINTDDIFSISYTGGEIYFTTGLQRILETPDENAVLVAHEMAHLERDHFLRIFRDSYDEYGPASILRFERPNVYGDFLIRLQRKLLHDGFPAAMEQEADDYAVQYLIRAGYRADVYAQTLHKIQEASETRKAKKSAWTRLHPMSPERLARVTALPGQLQAILDLAKTVTPVDPGAASVMTSQAVELASDPTAAQQFAKVLQASEGTAPYTDVRGAPQLRN